MPEQTLWWFFTLQPAKSSPWSLDADRLISLFLNYKEARALGLVLSSITRTNIIPLPLLPSLIIYWCYILQMFLDTATKPCVLSAFLLCKQWCSSDPSSARPQDQIGQKKVTKKLFSAGLASLTGSKKPRANDTGQRMGQVCSFWWLLIIRSVWC